MCLSNEDYPKRNSVIKNHMNNIRVNQKSIWNLEGHHSFQNIIGHFDWNPNFGSTSQGHNSFICYDFEVGSNALENERCLPEMLCWTKFQNLKRNTCDNAKHYRSLWTKCIERQKSPTSSAHNFFIKNPNDAKFKSKLLSLKISTTLMFKVLSFEAWIIETKGLEVGPFWQNSHTHVLHLELYYQFSLISQFQMKFCSI